ncbi:MAG: hypothetical protein R3E39_28000 [Anaerolineae bacterium]
MSQACDTGDQEAIGMTGQASGLFGRFAAAAAFSSQNCWRLGIEAKLNQWMAEEPRLAVLKHYIHNLFRKQQHVRSPEVEEVIAMTREPFRAGGQHRDAHSADMQFTQYASARVAAPSPEQR